MKNVLITGGAGFIGSNLTWKLINQGFRVTVLDNLSRQIHGLMPKEQSSTYKAVIAAGARFIEGSVTDKEAWIEALKDQDVVIHLAAETGTGQSMYEIKKYVDVNVGGTSILLDLLANNPHQVKKVIVASSRAIYGEGKYNCLLHGPVYPIARRESNMMDRDFECKCPHCGGLLELQATDESSKIHPSSVYGITKQAQEEMVLTVCLSLGIAAAAFRYQNVYGPGQSLSNPYTGILSIFSTQIRNGNPIQIFEDGRESRDFVYIDDVVDATILGITRLEANQEVFNVGSGIPISVWTVARQLQENYKSDVPIKITGHYRLGDIRHNFADLEKTSRLLGYQPQVSFKQGLQNFCNWVESQEIKEDHYQVSIDEMKLKGLYK